MRRRVDMLWARAWARLVAADVDAGLVRGLARKEGKVEVRRDVSSESESPRMGALKPPGLRARVARWDCRRVPVVPGRY